MVAVAARRRVGVRAAAGAGAGAGARAHRVALPAAAPPPRRRPGRRHGIADAAAARADGGGGVRRSGGGGVAAAARAPRRRAHPATPSSRPRLCRAAAARGRQRRGAAGLAAGAGGGRRRRGRARRRGRRRAASARRSRGRGGGVRGVPLLPAAAWRGAGGSAARGAGPRAAAAPTTPTPGSLRAAHRGRPRHRVRPAGGRLLRHDDAGEGGGRAGSAVASHNQNTAPTADGGGGTRNGRGRPSPVAPGLDAGTCPRPHTPPQEASAALGVGVTTLKKACRASGLLRWPYRARASIARLLAAAPGAGGPGAPRARGPRAPRGAPA